MLKTELQLSVPFSGKTHLLMKHLKVIPNRDKFVRSRSAERFGKEINSEDDVGEKNEY